MQRGLTSIDLYRRRLVLGPAQVLGAVRPIEPDGIIGDPTLFDLLCLLELLFDQGKLIHLIAFLQINMNRIANSLGQPLFLELSKGLDFSIGIFEGPVLCGYSRESHVHFGDIQTSGSGTRKLLRLCRGPRK